jgi:predicted NUDIX family NTP pyrophosphohydrolase
MAGMPKKSAGLLMYRRRNGVLEVFLIHPGGPFWKHKDVGAWAIPKGQYPPEEDALAAARREFQEETGFTAPHDGFQELAPIRQAGGKQVRAWAFEGDADATKVKSNLCEQEWPPRSGRKQSFPEVDRAAWYALPEAKRKILPSQLNLLEQLERLLAGKTGPAST